MDFIVEPIKNIFNYSGRTRRERYWKWTGFAILVNGLLNVLPLFDGGIISFFVVIPITIFLGLVGLSILARRLHDIGKSAWWLLIGLIPFIGIVVLFVFSLMDSERGTNQWGPSPKYPDGEYAEFQQESALYDQGRTH
jgi:uncharacterized membrane protein YhaH (DUF805 family)